MIIQPTKGLFTRSQIAELTGASESSLNFWMREGVLRSSEGDGGKGNHRKFRFYEVHIAALFVRLHRFGCNIEAFRQLSTIFHEAVDYIEGIDVCYAFTEDEWDILGSILTDRRRFNRDGYVERMVREGLEEYPGLERHKVGPYVEYVRLTWDQVVENWRNSRAGGRLTDKVLEACKKIEPKEFIDKSSIFSLITSIPRARHGDELDYFVRDKSGVWTVVADPAEASKISDAYIAVAMHSIKYGIWNTNE